MHTECEKFAHLLTGRQIGEEITEQEETWAKENGIVIVFGASDDLMEFRGAIHDEASVYDGGSAYLSKNGSMLDNYDYQNIQDLEGKLGLNILSTIKEIEAVWLPENNGKIYASWKIMSAIPYETFDIYEDEELYCIGIVFHIDSLKDEEISN